jgi:hypothetical protein
MPYVTGHKYKIHWRQGLDFETMQCDLSSRWTKYDKDLYLVLNFTDVRTAINVSYDGGPLATNRIQNNSLGNDLKLKSPSIWEAGNNTVFNESFSKYYKQFHFVINGKAMPAKSKLNFAI